VEDDVRRAGYKITQNTFSNGKILEEELKLAVKEGIWAAIVVSPPELASDRVTNLQVFSRKTGPKDGSECFVRGASYSLCLSQNTRR
jgi:hypothetical protein